jgi:hypothetical protein
MLSLLNLSVSLAIIFLKQGKLSFLQPDLDDALQFLTDLFKTGLSYSSLNTARGALSSLISMLSLLNLSVSLAITFLKHSKLFQHPKYGYNEVKLAASCIHL